MNPPGHTRLPAYLRGRPGVVVWDLGTLPFADARAAGDSTASQRAFTVRFANPDIWGLNLQQSGVLYDWDGQKAYGMIERSAHESQTVIG